VTTAAAAAAVAASSTSSLDELDILVLTASPDGDGAAAHDAGNATPDALPDAEASPSPSEEIGEHLASAAADAILPGLGLLMDLASVAAETTPDAAVGACAAPQQIQVVAPTRASRPSEDEDEDLQDLHD
jgi:hypothetical protein